MLVSRGPETHRKESPEETGYADDNIGVNIHSQLCEWSVLIFL